MNEPVTSDEKFARAKKLKAGDFIFQLVTRDCVGLNEVCNDRVVYLNISEARALRKWLDKVLP